MLIGMCGAEFPDVREFLARELPEAEISVIDHGALGVTRESYSQMAAAFAASVRSVI